MFLEMAFSDDLCRQFIELCLLLGCDYLEPIKGVGPKTAYKLMQEHGSLDKVLEHLRAKCALPWVCTRRGGTHIRSTGPLPKKATMARARRGRRNGVEFKYLKNGHGKKQRNFSRIRTLPLQTRLA